MGLHFTVDEMTNDSVVVSARDKDGKLIDVSAMGVTVEETGKSYTTPITIAALLAGGGICGVSAIISSLSLKCIMLPLFYSSVMPLPSAMPRIYPTANKFPRIV